MTPTRIQYFNVVNYLVLNFMVKPCINNIQHFNIQLMHTTLKNVVIRTF